MALEIPIRTSEARTAVEKLRTDLKELGLSSQRADKAAGKLRRELLKKLSADKADAAVDKLRHSVKLTRTEIIKMQMASGNVTGALNTMRTGVRRTVGHVTSLRSAFMGLGLGLVVGDIIRTGAQFEKTMAEVAGISGATGRSLEDLEQIARKMGETTEWSATQAAGGLKFLSMAGFTAKESIEALPGVLNLATAGNIELARAADISSNVLQAMQLEVSELSRVNDVMIETITTSNTNMDMMAESFKYAAPVASAFGYELEELSALVGSLGNAGVQGSAAGTQLAMAFQNAEKAFSHYGVSAKKADGSTKDLFDAVKLLEERGASASEIMDIFSQRAGRGVAILLATGSEQIERYTEELEASQDAADTLANTMRSTTVGAFKELMSVIESIKLDIFQSQVGGINETIKDLTEYFRDNSDEISAWGDALIHTINSVMPLAKGLGESLAYVGSGIAGWGRVARGIELTGEGVLSKRQFAEMGREDLKEFLEEYDKNSQLAIAKARKERAEASVESLTETGSFFVFGDKLKDAQQELKTATEAYNVELYDDALKIAEEESERFNKLVAEYTVEEHKNVSEERAKNAKEYPNTVLELQEQLSKLTRSDFELKKEAIEQEEREWKQKIDTSRLTREQKKEALETLSQVISLKEKDLAATSDAVEGTKALSKELKPLDGLKIEPIDTSELEKGIEAYEDATESIYKETGLGSGDYFDLQERKINEQVEVWDQAGVKIVKLEEWKKMKIAGLHEGMADDTHDLFMQQAESSEDFFEGLKAGFADAKEQHRAWGERGIEVAQRMADGMERSLGDVLYSAFEGEFDSIEDAWDSLWSNMVNIVSRAVADMAAEWAVAEGIGLLENIFKAHSGLFEMKKDEGLVMVQQGEMILPRGLSENLRQSGLITPDMHGNITEEMLARFTTNFFKQYGFQAAELATLAASGQIGIADSLGHLFDPSTFQANIAFAAANAITQALGLEQGKITTVGGTAGALVGASMLGPLGAIIGDVGATTFFAKVGDMLGVRNYEDLRDSFEDMYGNTVKGWFNAQIAFKDWMEEQDVLRDYYAGVEGGVIKPSAFTPGDITRIHGSINKALSKHSIRTTHGGPVASQYGPHIPGTDPIARIKMYTGYHASTHPFYLAEVPASPWFDLKLAAKIQKARLYENLPGQNLIYTAYNRKTGKVSPPPQRVTDIEWMVAGWPSYKATHMGRFGDFAEAHPHLDIVREYGGSKKINQWERRPIDPGKLFATNIDTGKRVAEQREMSSWRKGDPLLGLDWDKYKWWEEGFDPSVLNLPKFDTGSSYVSSTGPAVVHEGERIFSKSDNAKLISSINALVSSLGGSSSGGATNYITLSPDIMTTEDAASWLSSLLQQLRGKRVGEEYKTVDLSTKGLQL